MSDKRPFPARAFLAPRYWPMWLGFGLLKGVTLLPFGLIYPLGGTLGRLLYAAAASRRRVAQINIRQAYPEADEATVERLAKASFRSLGISVFETAWAWYGRNDRLARLATTEGLAHVERARAEGRPVILLAGHFTTLDIGARLLGFFVASINGVYKKAHNPLFEAMMAHCRARYGHALIENRNVRGVIRGLREGHPTWFAPDQDFADQDIVFTPFLGGVASTLTATAKMARMTGAVVIPFYQQRLEGRQRKGGHHYKLIFHPPLDDFPSDDIEADSARVNRAIETMVYALPEQYGWMHKRFKTTPDRSANIYARNSH